MGFSYLPLPIFFLMTMCVAAVLGYYAKVGWSSEPKALSTGYIILALTSLASGLIRIGEKFHLIQGGSSIGQLLTGLLTIVGAILLVIGSYKRQNDLEKKRAILIVLVIMGLVLAICAIGIYILIQLKRSNVQ